MGVVMMEVAMMDGVVMMEVAMMDGSRDDGVAMLAAVAIMELR